MYEDVSKHLYDVSIIIKNDDIKKMLSNKQELKKLINYNDFDYHKSYISDNQSSEKKQIKLKEICSILIERNKIREQHIQIQNNKFISFFLIERENEINEKCNKHKDSIIKCCSAKIKKFLRNIKYEKKYEIKNFKKMKNEILINEKERRLLTVVTNFYYKKLKKEFEKEIVENTDIER